jgi:hypothetical protein
MMKKNLKHMAAIALLIGFAVFALGSFGSSPSSSGGSYGGGGSSGSSYVTYTFINDSSYTVYVDGQEIPAGSRRQLSSNAGASWIMQMRYTPEDKVACSGLEGTTVRFYDR